LSADILEKRNLAKGKHFNNANPFLIGVMLFAFFLTPLLISDFQIAGSDMAEYLNNPVRILNGEMPYVDFWLLFPPYEVLLPAFIYKTFGININNIFLFAVLSNALIGVLSFIIGKLIFRTNFLAAIVSVLMVFGGLPAHQFAFTYPNLYLLFLLASSIFFILFIKKDYLPSLFITGVMMGISFGFRIHETGTVLLAAVLSVMVFAKTEKWPILQTVIKIIVMFSGFVVTASLVFLPIIKILPQALNALFVDSVSHGTSINLPYFYDVIRIVQGMPANLNGSLGIIYQLLILAMFSVCYIIPVFIFFSFFFIFKNLNKKDKVVILFFMLWGVFTFPKTLGRSDLAHLSAALSPLLFVLFFMLRKPAERLTGKVHRLIYRTAILLTAVLFFSVPIFLWYAFDTVRQPYNEIITEQGSLSICDNHLAHDIFTVINYIEQFSKKGDYIFVTSFFAPPFYALTLRKNPTYYDSLIDLVARPSVEKQQQICNDLLAKDTRLVIHSPNVEIESQGNFSFEHNSDLIVKCLKENFYLKRKLKYFRIYLRKPQQNQMKNDKKSN
jgi:hypothetical protein